MNLPSELSPVEAKSVLRVNLPPIPAKRYFTIGEVGDLCAVKPHVLRYWEQEFNQLKLDREKYRSIHMMMEDHNPKEYILSDSKQMPVNIARILDDTVYNYSDQLEELKDT